MEKLWMTKLNISNKSFILIINFFSYIIISIIMEEFFIVDKFGNNIGSINLTNKYVSFNTNVAGKKHLNNILDDFSDHDLDIETIVRDAVSEKVTSPLKIPTKNLIQDSFEKNETTKIKALEEEEAIKRKALEEEEAKKRKALEEEEAKKRKALEEEEARKKKVLEEEAKKKKVLEEEAKKKKVLEEEEAKKKKVLEEGLLDELKIKIKILDEEKKKNEEKNIIAGLNLEDKKEENTLVGGDIDNYKYYRKYLKYKSKYIELKNSKQ